VEEGEMIVRAPEGLSQSEAAGLPAERPVDRKPVLIGAYGRGNTGKTALLTALTQYCREQGASMQLWNLDQHQRSVSLETMFVDTRAPDDDNENERGRWLEERLSEQADERFDAVLDVGGGDTQIRNLAREIDLVGTLDERGIRLVAFHMVGPDPGDLDFLKMVVEDDLFVPAASVVVVNAGRLPSGRSARQLVEKVKADQSVLRVLKSGGRLQMMPRLACMTGVLERGISFREAMEGTVKRGQDSLSFFDQARVAKWWTEEMTAFFEAVPADWMPRRQPAEG
jgi:hypothetical protein